MSLAVERDLMVVCDEVYEHLTFDGTEHVPLATLPGMAGRTVTVSSAAKTFSVTGWKVGWVVGAPEVVDAVTTVKQFLTYVNAGPFQPAVARALALPDAFYTAQGVNLATVMTITGGVVSGGVGAPGGVQSNSPARSLFHNTNPGPRGTPFTAAVLKRKLKENGVDFDVPITEVPLSGRSRSPIK